MKRTNLKKLTLNRETLVSLNPDVLADVAGGNALTPSVPTKTTTTTGTTTQSRLGGCPSRITVCDPQQTRLLCGGPQQ